MKVTDEMAECAYEIFRGNVTDIIGSRATNILAMRAAFESVLGDLPEVRVPDGWKLVPIRPSREMLEDAAKAHQRARINAACIPGDSMKAAYKAMLSATPTPPRGE